MLRTPVGVFAFLLAVCPCHSSTLTGPQVLRRCERAYRSLRSYQGTTRVTGRSSRPGGPEYVEVSQARIWFTRTGSIRVEGTLTGQHRATHPGTYAIASSGANTFVRWTVDGNRWTKSESVDLAVAGFTGVSGGVCTTIPTLLFSMKDGKPWSSVPKEQQNVVIERVQGKKAYRVGLTDRFAGTTVWIDHRTMLLLKVREVRNDDELAKAMGKEEKAEIARALADIPANTRKELEADDARDRKRGPLTTTTTQTYVNVRTNGSIPAAVFRITP